MKRAIVTPPILAPAALAELKDWLAITTTRDDAPLHALLLSALDLFEAFTGQMALECTVREIIPANREWQALTTRPVQAIIAVEALTGFDPAVSRAPEDYAIALDLDGGGRIRMLDTGSAERVAVHFIAGIAPAWSGLPDAVRHGVVRLAAHAWRERDTGAAVPLPPSAVAALWRPWRRMRIA